MRIISIEETVNDYHSRSLSVVVRKTKNEQRSILYGGNQEARS